MRIHARKNIRWNGIVNWEKNAWNNNRFILEKIGCFYGLYYKRIKEEINVLDTLLKGIIGYERILCLLRTKNRAG